MAETIDRLQRENAALQQRIGDLEQQLASGREAEEMLKKTLVTAQRAAEEAIAQAKARAEQLISEAEARARKASEDARQRIAATEAEAQRRAQEAERSFDARKRDYETTIEGLKTFERELKARLKGFLENQLRALDALGAPSARPAPLASEGARLQARPAEGVSPRSDQGEGR